MLKVRIIPCLDIIKNKVVKGVKFKNIKTLGDPVLFAKKYSDSGADEICMLDITASHEKRKTFLKTVEAIAKVIDIPLTVGGGVSQLNDITTLLNAGADKISINTAAVLNPNLIKKASIKHGSQCIVVAIDGKRHNKKMIVTIKGGREKTDKTLINWAKKMQAFGAGELLVTSMDTDGVQKGFDKEMLKLINKEVTIPVIASGGVGKLRHFIEGYETNSSGLLAASVFHTSKYSITKVKNYLKRNKIPVRL
ncbi:MAG: imidazole glycerol phosphate synthase subunit HisF [Pelagibacteraceae bacterium]|nr:imidazole glycerol phosphate synthase subunit HisF [Pelagibacteraceae bacterium]|tara:strand:+ start:1140 stop:1892 length:753 start_codon:yes stop_codon:yes gene_type:complete